jgi:hypothetical protein
MTLSLAFIAPKTLHAAIAGRLEHTFSMSVLFEPSLHWR